MAKSKKDLLNEAEELGVLDEVKDLSYQDLRSKMAELREAEEEEEEEAEEEAEEGDEEEETEETVNAKDAVDVRDNGAYVRTYSKKRHGGDFKKLAESFASQKSSRKVVASKVAGTSEEK